MPPGGVDKNKTAQQKRNAARAKAVARKPAQKNEKLREAPKPKPKPAPPDILRGPYDAPNRPMVPTAPRPMPVVRIEPEKERTPRPPRATPIAAPRPRPTEITTPQPRPAPVPAPRPAPQTPTPQLPEPELQRLRGWRGYDKPLTGDYTLAQGWGENPAMYKSGGWAGHAGLDWGLPEGTPVQTLAPGRVIAAVENTAKTGYGTYVIVEHPNGDQTLYGHLSALNVKEGDEVGYGSVLGKSGDTGFSFNENGVGSFPHLHLGYKPAEGGDAAYGGWADPTSILGQYTPGGVWEQRAYPYASTSSPQRPPAAPPAQPRPWVSGSLPADFEQTQERAVGPFYNTATGRDFQYRVDRRNEERDATDTALQQAQEQTDNPWLSGWYGVNRGLNTMRRVAGNTLDALQLPVNFAMREPNDSLWGVPYRRQEDGTVEWVPPWTYRWNEPEGKTPFQPVIGPQPQSDVQTMPFGVPVTAGFRGFLASQQGTTPERRAALQQSFAGATQDYADAAAAVSAIPDPELRADAEIGLLAGTYTGRMGEDLKERPQAGAGQAVNLIQNQARVVDAWRYAASRLMEDGEFVRAGKLLAQAEAYETLNPAQLSDRAKDLVGNLFVDVVFDPLNLLEGAASVVGLMADARRGARALAPAVGNLAMQADDALRRAAALKQAAGVVDDVTSATQAADLRNIPGATIGEKASKVPFLRWFTLTPESYAKLRTGEVFHYASGLLNKLAGSGEMTAGDVLKVLSTAVTDPMKLARGMAAGEFTGPAARALAADPRQLIQWGSSAVVPRNLREFLPLLAYALPDIAKLPVMQNVNEVVDMAKFGQQFDDIVYDAARRLYGRSELLQVPIGTDVRQGMKVVKQGKEYVIEFRNKAGDLLSTTAPMGKKAADSLLKEWKNAAKAPGSSLAAPFKAAAGAQRAIMTDFFLGLSPRNWILNAATAHLAMLVEKQSTLGLPIAQIDAYMQAKLGATMGNRRVFEGVMGATSGLGGGTHWLERMIGENKYSAIMNRALAIPYGRTELGGVGVGEQNMYTRAFYSVFKRVMDRNWDWMVNRMLANDLAQYGIDPNIGRTIIAKVAEAGRNGNGQDIVTAVREAVLGQTVTPTVSQLGVMAGTISPEGEKQLNRLMVERPAGWEQEALDIFKREMQPHFDTLEQAPPDYQVEEWIKATGVQDSDLIYSALYEAALNQGTPKQVAAQRARQVADSIGASYDDVIRGVATDLRNMPQSAAATQQVIGGWAQLHRLLRDMRGQIDNASQEAIAALREGVPPATAWAKKWQATEQAAKDFVAARDQWLVTWRDRIQRAAAGEEMPDPADWRELIEAYLRYDDEAAGRLRGLEAARTGTQQYEDIIAANRAMSDASYVRLFEALRQNGTADALDILYAARKQADRVFGVVSNAVAKERAKAIAKKIQWEDYYTLRNALWRKAFETEVLVNEYALRYIVADSLQKGGANTTWNGLNLVGPAGNGKWIARKPGDFAPQFVDEAQIPPEVMQAWRRAMHPETQAQTVDEAIAEIGRATGTDTTPPPTPKAPYTTPTVRPLPVEPRPGALEALRAGQAPPPAQSMQPEAVAQRMAQQAQAAPAGVPLPAHVQGVLDAAQASGMQNANVPVRVVNSINAHAGEIGLERRIGDLSELTPEEAELVRAYYANRSAPVAEAVQAAPPPTVAEAPAQVATPPPAAVEEVAQVAAEAAPVVQRIVPPAKLAAQKGGKALTPEQRKWVVAQLNALVPEGFREQWPSIRKAAVDMGVLGKVNVDDAAIAANRQVLKNLGDVPIGVVEIEIPGDGILRVDSAAQAMNAADAVAKGRIESVSIPHYDSIPAPRKMPIEDAIKNIEDYNNSLGIIFDPISYQLFAKLSDFTRRFGGKRTQTIGDLATHQVTTLLDAQRAFFTAMRRQPQSIPNTLTPQQRQAILDLVYERLLPAYDNLLGEAAEAGRRGADRTMLNYDRRRGFDEILSILSPYHYYWSRAPLNWAMRLARHPGALGMIADWQNTWQREAENRGDYFDPQRVEGKIQAGDTGVWIGNYLDRVLPFAGLMGNPFVDEDSAQSPGESAYLWMKAQGVPLWGPLGEAAIARMLDTITPRPEGAAPRYKDFGLADILGPLGREAAALGQGLSGTIMPWWVSGDQYRTGVAGRYLTTQGEGTPSEKLWALDVLQQGQQGLEPLPEQPEGVGPLAEQAIRAAGMQDAIVAGIQGMTGIPNNMYTADEAAMRELQASRRALGYNEETGIGSAAAVEGFDQQTENITYPFAKYTDLYPQTTLEPEERERLGITAARRDRSEEMEPVNAAVEKGEAAVAASVTAPNVPTEETFRAGSALLDELDAHYEEEKKGIYAKYPSIPEAAEKRDMPAVNGTVVQFSKYNPYYSMNPEEARARMEEDAEYWAYLVTQEALGERPTFPESPRKTNPNASDAAMDAYDAARRKAEAGTATWQEAYIENYVTILSTPELVDALTFRDQLQPGQEPYPGLVGAQAISPEEARKRIEEVLLVNEPREQFYTAQSEFYEGQEAQFAANISTRMGADVQSLYEQWSALPRVGGARERFQQQHPELRLAKVAGFNPKEYDEAVRLFGEDAVLAWGYVPAWIEGDAAQDELRDKYYAENPKAFIVGAWINGRRKPDNPNADPEDYYDFGKDYNYAIKTWGENVWNVAAEYKAGDKAHRRAMYRQYGWLEEFWDWWYEYLPDTEGKGKGTGSGYSRGFSGGRGGATYSNIGSGAGTYFPYWNTPDTQYNIEWGDNPFAKEAEQLRRWRPPERRRMGVEPQLQRLRNWR